jgi:erythromycin esterase-like protein
MMRSNAQRSTTRSRTIGNAAARHGSTVTCAPSWNLRMCSWHVAVPISGRAGLAVDHHPARAADALAAVVVERDRL